MASATPEQPRLTLFAGPNGAGKTTAYRRFVDAGYAAGVYLNPDDVRRNLPDGKGGDVAAGREVVSRTRSLIAERRTFTRETTLAGGEVVRAVASARDAGYRVVMVFVGVESLGAIQCRVAFRVASGGHDVGLETQRRRYRRSLDNASRVARVADVAYFLDNGGLLHTLVTASDRGVVRFSDSDGLDWVEQATRGLSSAPGLSRQGALAELRRAERLGDSLAVREERTAYRS